MSDDEALIVPITDSEMVVQTEVKQTEEPPDNLIEESFAAPEIKKTRYEKARETRERKRQEQLLTEEKYHRELLQLREEMAQLKALQSSFDQKLSDTNIRMEERGKMVDSFIDGVNRAPVYPQQPIQQPIAQPVRRPLSRFEEQAGQSYFNRQMDRFRSRFG